MKTNMGSIDRVIRIIVAIALATLWLTDTIKGVAGTIFVIVAIVFVLTSLIGFCPLYSIIGLNTCSKKN
jgi:hypothetical protein